MALYGNKNTMHGSEEVNVELDEDGKVVAVWFRCLPLAFTQHVKGEKRAVEMRAMTGAKITAVQTVEELYAQG